MGRVIGKRRLYAHPSTASAALEHFGVKVTRGIDELWAIEFVTIGRSADMVLPDRRPAERADELWKNTVFELFVQPEGSSGYFEFNFSPSTRWAAYHFEGYRRGMRNLPLLSNPVIEIEDNGVRYALTARIDLSSLPPGSWRMGLSAVIEETDGTKSFWALAHPAGKPDFHDPACFVLELPAPSAP